MEFKYYIILESIPIKNSFYSQPLDFEPPNTPKGTPIIKIRSADQGQSFSNKCQTVLDQAEASYFMEAGTSPPVISHANNKVLAYERLDSFKSDEILIKNETPRAQSKIILMLSFDIVETMKTFVLCLL